MVANAAISPHAAKQTVNEMVPQCDVPAAGHIPLSLFQVYLFAELRRCQGSLTSLAPDLGSTCRRQVLQPAANTGERNRLSDALMLPRHARLTAQALIECLIRIRRP